MSDYEVIAPQHALDLEGDIDPYVLEGVAYSPLKVAFLHNYADDAWVRCDECDWTTTVSELPEDHGRVRPPLCPDCAKEGELGFVRVEHRTAEPEVEG